MARAPKSLSETVERARSALTALSARREPFTLLFCHAVFIRIMHWIALTQRPVMDSRGDAPVLRIHGGWDVPNCGVLPMLGRARWHALHRPGK